MKRYLLAGLLALAVVSVSEAGVLKFTYRHVVRPAKNQVKDKAPKAVHGVGAVAHAVFHAVV